MNRELKRVSAVVLLMFLTLFGSTSVIQVLAVDKLRVDVRNTRTLYNSYSAERGPLLVDGVAIAESVPVDDPYNFQRVYSQPELYAAITGYFTLNQQNPGMEGALNDFLSGSANAQFLDNLTSIATGQSPKGAAVELTIDPLVQQAAWDALGNQRGAVIALDPKTGAILALVSKPSYDPNLLAAHDNAAFFAEYQRLTEDEGTPLINRALAGDLYHPGSVFKVLMAAAAIDSGRFTPESEFDNPAELPLPGSDSLVQNAGGALCGPGEKTSLATALRFSCNIPFAEMGLQLGQETISEYAARFGFGQRITVPLPVTPSIYPSGLNDPRLMLSSFGQDDVRVTPLQMAMVASAVANGGEIMQPTLVESILAPDLSELQSFSAERFAKPISRETAEILTRMMVSGVAEGAASNARIEGVEVAGKTGTAENGLDEPYTLWFTGFAPANDPRVVVVVVVENGGGFGQSSFGNAIAAPIAKKVLEAVLFQ